MGEKSETILTDQIPVAFLAGFAVCLVVVQAMRVLVGCHLSKALYNFIVWAGTLRLPATERDVDPYTLRGYSLGIWPILHWVRKRKRKPEHARPIQGALFNPSGSVDRLPEGSCGLPPTLTSTCSSISTSDGTRVPGEAYQIWVMSKYEKDRRRLQSPSLRRELSASERKTFSCGRDTYVRTVLVAQRINQSWQLPRLAVASNVRRS